MKPGERSPFNQPNPRNSRRGQKINNYGSNVDDFITSSAGNSFDSDLGFDAFNDLGNLEGPGGPSSGNGGNNKKAPDEKFKSLLKDKLGINVDEGEEEEGSGKKKGKGGFWDNAKVFGLGALAGKIIDDQIFDKRKERKQQAQNGGGGGKGFGGNFITGTIGLVMVGIMCILVVAVLLVISGNINNLYKGDRFETDYIDRTQRVNMHTVDPERNIKPSMKLGAVEDIKNRQVVLGIVPYTRIDHQTVEIKGIGGEKREVKSIGRKKSGFYRALFILDPDGAIDQVILGTTSKNTCEELETQNDYYKCKKGKVINLSEALDLDKAKELLEPENIEKAANKATNKSIGFLARLLEPITGEKYNPPPETPKEKGSSAAQVEGVDGTSLTQEEIDKLDRELEERANEQELDEALPPVEYDGDPWKNEKEKAHNFKERLRVYLSE